MRKSSLRHPVAVLRQILGLSQPEFAPIVGIAESTLAKIESRRLRLSEENALRISTETGAGFRWLLNDDVTAPILDENRKPYTEQEFARVREARAQGRHPNEREYDVSRIELHSDLRGLLQVLHSADKRGNLPLAGWRIHRFVNDLKNEFRQSEARESLEFCNSIMESLTSEIQGAASQHLPPTRYRLGKRSKK